MSEEAILEDFQRGMTKVSELQPRALGYIKANGFVFDDIGSEPGNWQHLAFSLYTELCEADSIARELLGTSWETEPHP